MPPHLPCPYPEVPPSLALLSPRYTVIMYNTQDTVIEVLDDDSCVLILRDILNWAESDTLMRRLADTSKVGDLAGTRGKQGGWTGFLI